MNQLMELMAGISTQVYIIGVVVEFTLAAAVVPFLVRKLRRR